MWLGLEDARILWLLAKQAAFFGLHYQFGDMVLDHYNQGLDITRYWAKLNITYEGKLSYLSAFKFSNFGDNRYI